MLKKRQSHYVCLLVSLSVPPVSKHEKEALNVVTQAMLSLLAGGLPIPASRAPNLGALLAAVLYPC